MIDLKMKFLTILVALISILVVTIIFGLGPAIGVCAWIWMGVGIRQALSGSKMQEYDSTLVLLEGEIV